MTKRLLSRIMRSTMAELWWPSHRSMWWHDGRRNRLRTLIGLILAALLAVLLARLPLVVSTAALLGTAFLIATFAHPVAGLVAIGLALPLGGALPLQFGPAGIVDLLVVLTVVAWLARGLSERQISFRWPPLAVALLLFVWTVGLSLTQALSWREGLPEWLKWLEFAVLYLVGCQVLGWRRVPLVVAALLAAGVAEAALGAYQFLRQDGPEGFILLGRFMRAYGTFRQPNPYAGYLGYLFPVALSLALGGVAAWWAKARSHREKAGPEFLKAAAYATAAAALAAGIVMSWSRGAWLGLAAAAVVVVGFRSRRTALLTVAGLAVVAALILTAGTAWLPGFLGERLNDLGGYLVGPDPARTEINDANFSVLERLAHWQAGWRMFGDHPWLGVGIGNYAVRYAEYELPHWYEALGHAHNVFINFLAETGILGAAALAVFWLGIPLMVYRIVRRAGSEAAARIGGQGIDVRSLALGLAGTWTYVTVHNLFDNLFVQHIQLQLALLMVAVVAAASPFTPAGAEEAD